MSSSGEFLAGAGIEAYFLGIAGIHARVLESQREVLIAVAEKMASTMVAGGRIFVFGTGHSHMLAEEGYCRAGGLMTVVPIFYSALMLHESIPMEAKVERTPGLANDLLDRAGIKAGEMLVVYSNSGVNQMPVEMVLEAKRRGVVTVGMCSNAFTKVAPLSGLGKRLWEVADFAIDNGGVAGDGIVDVPGVEWKVGPSSTVIGALLWNALVVEAAWRVKEAVGEVPVCASQNMPGAREYSTSMRAKGFALAPKYF